MGSTPCLCGNKIYLDNHVCLQCGAPVGLCSACLQLTSFDPESGACHQCHASDLEPCQNQAVDVCNGYAVNGSGLCHWCQFTETIPDLSQSKPTERWKELEKSKRRLLLELRALGLPPYVRGEREDKPLRFRFLQDEIDSDGKVIKVLTGHSQGIITINVAEADSVVREKARLALHEPVRTLIGHMRHEIGHYIDWNIEALPLREKYRAVFGDPTAIDYAEARDSYYANGPAAGWPARFVSAYASMHPWEDFAETVRTYLELQSILAIATKQGAVVPEECQGVEEIIKRGLEISVLISEFNASLGLPSLLYEKFNAEVTHKLDYVHGLAAGLRLRWLQYS